jgi:hypothetical protein
MALASRQPKAQHRYTEQQDPDADRYFAHIYGSRSEHTVGRAEEAARDVTRYSGDNLWRGTGTSSISNPRLSSKYNADAGVATSAESYDKQGFVPPSTTFYARQAESYDDELQFDRFWKIQMGLLPPKWRSTFSSGGEPIDEVEHGFRIDPRWRDVHQVVECVLDEFPEWIRTQACSRVWELDQSDMNRFNRHYSGLAGVAISAALTILYDRAEVKDPSARTPWADDVLRSLCEELSNDFEGQIRLAEKVWEGWQ